MKGVHMRKLPIVILLIALIASILSLGIGCNGKAGIVDEKIESEEAEVARDSEEKEDTAVEESEEVKEEAKYDILYHITGHTIISQEMDGTKCYSLYFREYFDGGYVKPDGSENKILDLKDYPTSMVTSKKYDNFYYISSPNNPLSESYGYKIFNWDIGDQTLWSSDFVENDAVEIKSSAGDKFPGGVTTSPGNNYLIYLITQTASNQSEGFMVNKINPFVSDSSLIIANTENGEEKTVLLDSYNRQLFTSFADFSADGNSFYTIAREGESFKFVKISLESGEVTDFTEAFPGFDWKVVNWDEFFPKTGDFAYASFSISPDEKRLIAYKNIFTASMDNPCFTDALHKLWIFNLENNATDIFENQEGYVSDSSWKYDSTEFVLAIMGSSGCYPDYMDARIDKIDKDGNNKVSLVNELKSKITNLGWSPGGMEIAYDVYGMDLVGRLKLVDATGKEVKEIINTKTLGYEANASEPVLLLFADWVAWE